MRGRHGGRYHVKHNNCQHFTEELWRRICVAGYDISNANLRPLGSLASHYDWKWLKCDSTAYPVGLAEKLDEKMDDSSESTMSI